MTREEEGFGTYRRGHRSEMNVIFTTATKYDTSIEVVNFPSVIRQSAHASF